MKNLFHKLCTIWSLSKSVFKDEPIKRWRLNWIDKDGTYVCDGDCGRYKFHGVCTCGLTHHLKWCQDRHKQKRDNVSFRREYQTEEIMMNVPYETNCRHGVHLNSKCETCETEINQFIKEFEAGLYVDEGNI